MRNTPFNRMIKDVQTELNQELNRLMKELMRKYGKLMPNITREIPQQFDPYLILGLTKEASDDEIRNRYKEMMQRIHPDIAGKEFTALSQFINVSYSIICQQRGIK